MNCRDIVQKGVRGVELTRRIADESNFGAAALTLFNRVTHLDLNVPISVTNEALEHPLRMETQASDFWTIREVLQQGAYEIPKEFDARINGLPIIDIGAYIGAASCYFASRYTQSSIAAVEPNPRNFNFLRRNVAPYGSRIVAMQAAVVPRAGRVAMSRLPNVDPNQMTQRFGLVDDGGTAAEHPTTVLGTSPDTVVAQLGEPSRIGLVKVDIEGAEAALFSSNVMDEILGRTNVLAVETHDAFVTGCTEAVEAVASRTNFEFVGTLGDDDHTRLYVAA